MKKLWGWIKRIFGGASRVLQSNKALAKAAVRLSLGAFLEHNKGYADEVLRALKGLSELVREGKISTNDELRREIAELLSGDDVPLYLSTSLRDVVEAVFASIDDNVRLSGDQYKDLWLDVIGAAMEMAMLYAGKIG